ncbi:19121_t:CDS:1, partial [Gigaspora rosea]
MVKVSIILISLIFILHVHLTTTLPAHAIEGRNLTMLLSGHEFEKRGNDSSKKSIINIFKKGTIIKRPRNRPRFVLISGSVEDCKEAKDPVAFSTCCALYNRNTVNDTPRPPRLTFRSRMRLWWHDFTNMFAYNRFIPDSTPVRDPPFDLNDRFLKTLEINGQETRIPGPYVLDILTGDLIFLKPLRHKKKYEKKPFCSKLHSVPEENPILCLPPSSESIIRPFNPSKDNPYIPYGKPSKKTRSKHHRPDKQPKVTYSLSSRLEIDPLEMANYNGLLAYYDELDSETYLRVTRLYHELSNKFANLEEYLRDLKEWAEFLGISIVQASRRVREVGESSGTYESDSDSLETYYSDSESFDSNSQF